MLRERKAQVRNLLSITATAPCSRVLLLVLLGPAHGTPPGNALGSYLGYCIGCLVPVNWTPL